MDDQSYLLEVIRYVLLNPVRAGMVSTASDWPWSSFLSTVGESLAPRWLAASEVLAYFAKEDERAVRAFRAFVDAGISIASPWTALTQDIYLGDSSFVERTQAKMIDAQRRDPEIPRSQRLRKPPTLDEFFVQASNVSEAILTAYRSGRFTMRQIAEHLGAHYSTISRIIARSDMPDCKT